MMLFISGFLAAAVVAVIAAAIVIYGGLYNVSATDPHNELVGWALSTTSRNSVAARADATAVPDLNDEARWKAGLSHYDGTCRTCHGAPGVERSAIGKGLRPQPPELARAAATWSTGELFWIVKHGIKMTGMPAFRPTHSDDDLWSMVAFLRRLPDISADEYRKLVQRQNGVHHHGDGAHDATPAAVIEMTNTLQFTPPEVTVVAGNSVRWTNVSRLVHTVTADPVRARDADHVALPSGAETFNSGNIEPGGTFIHRFEAPGTYRYFCIPHEAAGMTATVIVKGAKKNE